MEVLRTFDQECLNAADNARRTLITILQDNADTEYGKNLPFVAFSAFPPRQRPYAGINSGWPLLMQSNRMRCSFSLPTIVMFQLNAANWPPLCISKSWNIPHLGELSVNNNEIIPQDRIFMA